MSSGTRPEVGRIRRMMNNFAAKIGGGASLGKKENQAQINTRIARLGLTKRQQDLNWLWAWYRTQHYAARKLDWDGRQEMDPIEHEAVATAGFLPPGFTDVGASLPVKFLKPKAPYALPKVIVDRFTGLLFSERHHPQVRVEGDELTEDFIGALIEESRLWAHMIQARTHGGGMGTAIVGFQFVDGKPEIEIHDPRWCFPSFANKHKHLLRSLEIRYMYSEEVTDPVTGVAEEVDFWYRRIINMDRDVLFKREPVGDGEEPQWQVEKDVSHGFGFCPVYWIQNMPVQDDIDGDTDCVGVYEIIENMDQLLSGAIGGTLKNCDPTVVITTTAPLGEIRKGSDNALKVPDGAASYMEMNGGGVQRAMELVEATRRFALEVAQCVLEHPDQANRTATEVERAFASMLAKADVMREQYGEKGIKPLIDGMIAAARKLSEGKVDETGQIVKQALILPPRIVKKEDGSLEIFKRQLGLGNGTMKLQWPHYFDPVLSDVQTATTASSTAKTAGLIDAEHASKFVAEYFGVEDVPAMLRKIKLEAKDREAEMQASMMGNVGAFGSSAKGAGF